jgi:hypothetical protein
MKTITNVAAVIIVLALTGCGTPKILTATEQSITIDIENTGMTTSEMISKGVAIADAHCKKFGKKASLEKTTGFWGAASIAHFKCQ